MTIKCYFLSLPSDPVSPAHPEESLDSAKEHPAFQLVPTEPESTESHVEAVAPPLTQTVESSPMSPQPESLKAGSPEAAEEEEPSEEPMDTGTEGLVLDSPVNDVAQPSQEEEEDDLAARKMELEERFSPQLSEEEEEEEEVALEEGPATAGREPNETSLSFAGEPKRSPSPVEADLLGGTSTPMEAYRVANPLEGGAAGDEEARSAPAPLRPHPLVKSDIVNEISNLSQGDASTSCFASSELPFASPYHEGGGSLSLEMAGLTSTDVSLQREDGTSLPLGDMDDSLLYDIKGEGEKGRRRSSPARSRVKQVSGASCWAILGGACQHCPALGSP